MSQNYRELNNRGSDCEKNVPKWYFDTPAFS